MHRVLVCGGRDYQDARAVDAALSALEAWLGPFVLICGDARGADSLAADWSLQRGRPTIKMPAAWKALSRRAGHVRNGWMLEHTGPTYAVAFPGGAGTQDMIAQAEAAGLTVWRPYV